MIEEILAKVNVDLGVLPDEIKNSYSALTTLSIEHKYPLPSDEASARQVALNEVQTNVRSHQAYIEEFSKKEQADKEWNRILEEQAQLDEVTAGALPQLAQELDEQEIEDEQERPEETDEEASGSEHKDEQHGEDVERDL